MPALPPYIIEPIFEQFLALLPDRVVHHPLGCHKPRIPDRVILEKLVQILVFGCAYRRIAEEGCSATAIRDRRDEWIELGVMEALRQIALSAYDRLIGLELEEVAVDGCITKAPCGGEKAGKSPVDRASKAPSADKAVDGKGIPLGSISAGAKAATTRRFWFPLWSMRRRRWDLCPKRRASTWTEPTTRSSHASACQSGT